MEQTPIHDSHNPDLLKVIPKDSKRLIEVGCSSGALAREFKKINPNCDYLGIEIDAQYSILARRYCNECLTLDIEKAENDFWMKNADRDCWIFGDTLEHLKDPWDILDKIRKIVSPNSVVVACIPNAQHWSLQVRLSIGHFRYEANGLLDKTHLRWFTRQTIIELFLSTGFVISECFPRVFGEPMRNKFLPVIENFAKLAGVDPKIAVSDSMPFQYVIKAIPK